MARQTFTIPASAFSGSLFGTGSNNGWGLPAGGYLPVDAALAPAGATRLLGAIYDQSAFDFVALYFAETQTDSFSGFSAGHDLTPAFESGGSVTLEQGTHSATFALAGADVSEPYEWNPANYADFAAFIAAIDTAQDIEVTLDDGVTGVSPEALSMTARAGDPTATMNLAAVAPPPSTSRTLDVGLPTVSEAGPPPRMRFLSTTPRLLIDPALVDGGGSAYFGNLQLYFDRDLPMGLRVSADESASFGAALPNLTAALEISHRALILSAGGHTVEIPGPTNSTNQTSDTGDEPYDWLPSAAKVTEIQAWMATFMGLSQAEREATTLTFDDAPPPPPPPLELSMSARAGNPTATMALSVLAGPPEALSMSARAGNPTARLSLTAVPPPVPSELAMTARAGVPTATMNLRALAPVPFELSMTARAGDPTARFSLTALGAPSVPFDLVADEVGQTGFLLSWTAGDDGGSPITDWEVRVGSGLWISTGTSAAMYRFTGLESGTSYLVTVRAVNVRGRSAASPALAISTASATEPGLPRFATASDTGGTSLDLEWTAPEGDGGGQILRYEICVIDEDGTAQPFERTDDASTTWRVRGLAIGHTYGFRIRAVNSAGRGPATPVFYVTVERAPVLGIAPEGGLIPLIDADRQALIVRLDDKDCRIRVWWQPSDLSWWASLEVPTNTPSVSGRRLALNAGILDRIADILPGNIVCRERGTAGLEPGRDAWARQTHGLFYEPVQMPEGGTP